MNNKIFIQIIGAIGYGLLAYSYFEKKKKDILLIEIVSYMFFVTHYYLLDGITGAICNFIGMFALFVIYIFDKYELKHKSLISTLFILLLLIVNIMTFQNIYSIFPLIASIIVIISFMFDDENKIRLVGIISAVCWLIYAIVYKSYIAIIFEVLTLINVSIAYYKNSSKVLRQKRTGK